MQCLMMTQQTLFIFECKLKPNFNRRFIFPWSQVPCWTIREYVVLTDSANVFTIFSNGINETQKFDIVIKFKCANLVFDVRSSHFKLFFRLFGLYFFFRKNRFSLHFHSFISPVNWILMNEIEISSGNLYISFGIL